jgi:hypothetical protein
MAANLLKRMDLKTYIKEVTNAELRKVLRETITGGATFSIQELESITEPRLIMSYLNKTLGGTALGGQGRVVYNIDDKTIVKFAYDSDYQQNKVELENSLCLGEKYAVKVIHHHPKFYWLIEERLKLLSLEAFNKEILNRTGVKMDGVFDFPDAVQTEMHDKISKQAEIHNAEMKKSPWYLGLLRGLKKCTINSRDFHYANWGIRPSTGELILLDLGF